jgi:hypothetical protein
MTEEREKKEEENKIQGVRGSEERDENLSRIVITKAADTIINEVVENVNRGFDAGKATRLDVTSFIISWFKSHLTDDVIHQIRISCSNELSMLDAVVKRYKTTGELPPPLRAALTELFFGGDAVPAKKAKKSLKPEGIIDRHTESEAA